MAYEKLLRRVIFERVRQNTELRAKCEGSDDETVSCQRDL